MITIPSASESATQTLREGRPFTRLTIVTGFAVLAVFCGTLAAWSFMAPVESAVIAPGIVSVDTDVRTVQHLEGGIVEQILVREGDAVTAGDVLIRLQNTVPLSALTELQSEYFELQALEARLVAERDGLDTIRFPAELADKVGDRTAQDAMAGQIRVFASRRALLADRVEVLQRASQSLQGEATGLRAQISAAERELAIIAQETETAHYLHKRGLSKLSRALELEREQAQLEGTINGYRGAIISAERKIDETRTRIQELRSEQTANVAEALGEVRRKASDLRRSLTAAADRAVRTQIIAPISGMVVNLKVHTVGGVVSSGESLLEVVPGR